MTRGFLREKMEVKLSFDQKVEIMELLGLKKQHLTLHSKFGPATIFVDHDKENHQKDAGKGSKSNCYGHLLEAKHRQSRAVTGGPKTLKTNAGTQMRTNLFQQNRIPLKICY